MADLSNQTPADTYKSLLQIGDATNGVDATAKYIEDGEGTDSALAISTTAVGIGTDSPDAPLHIVGSPASTLILERDSADGTAISSVVLKDGSDDQVRISSTDSKLRLETGSGNDVRMLIDSDGKVGIGTASPDAKLHIPQGSTIGGIDLSNACILAGSTSTGIGIDDNEIIKRQGTNGGHLNIGSQGVDASIVFKTGADTANGNIPFDRMRIDSEGNVGIGTDDPSTTLHAKKGDSSVKFLQDDKAAITLEAGSLADFHISHDGTTNKMYVSHGTVVGNAKLVTINANDGNVGIGTDSPTAPLHVVGKFANDGYGVFTASTSAPGVYVNKTDADLTQSTDYIHFRNTGQFSGEISYDGTDVVISQTSDARLKENIKDSGSGLNIVNNLQIRSFDWVGEKRKSKRFGFIAQEMHKVFKEAVKVGGEDENEEPWAISDSKLIPVLTKAIQEQQQIIDQLKSQNESQQSTINDLASRIETLENK
jgi:hypothetical protein